MKLAIATLFAAFVLVLISVLSGRDWEYADAFVIAGSVLCACSVVLVFLVLLFSRKKSDTVVPPFADGFPLLDEYAGSKKESSDGSNAPSL